MKGMPNFKPAIHEDRLTSWETVWYRTNVLSMVYSYFSERAGNNV